MREKVALNETGLRLWGLVARGWSRKRGDRRHRVQGAGARAPSERVEGRWWIGWLKPFRPSNGDGHRAGVAGASGPDQGQGTEGERDRSWASASPREVAQLCARW